MARLWTINEIAELTGIGRDAIDWAIRRGQLRSIKVRSVQNSTRTRNGKSVMPRHQVAQEWLVEWLGYDPLAEPERARQEMTARRQRNGFVDRTGQRYGKLVAVSCERRKVKQENGQRAYRTHVYWLCECDCGNKRELPSSWFSTYANREGELSCEDCSQASESGKLSAAMQRRLKQGEELFKKVEEFSPYVLNYREYRAGFTAAQRARYDELMEGRAGEKHEALAVDVVMREPQPGACCEHCLKQEQSAFQQPASLSVAAELAAVKSESSEMKKLIGHRRERSEAAAQTSKRAEIIDSRPMHSVDRLSLLRAVYRSRTAGTQSRAQRSSDTAYAG